MRTTNTNGKELDFYTSNNSKRTILPAARVENSTLFLAPMFPLCVGGTGMERGANEVVAVRGESLAVGEKA